MKPAKGSADPLKPIDGGRLAEAIRYWGVSHRALAKVLSRPRYPVHPQTLDALCSNVQPRCRASLRRALAVELEIPEAWLAGAPVGLTLAEMMPNGWEIGRGVGKTLQAWGELVLGLKLDPAVHTALLDLPGAIGQASLATGLLTVDPSGHIFSAPRLARANLREREAWLDWLRAWIDREGKAEVRAKLTRALPHLTTRFARVNRFKTPPAPRSGSAPSRGP